MTDKLVKNVMTRRVAYAKRDATRTDIHKEITGTILGEFRHIQGVVAVRDRLTYPEPDMVAAPGFYVNH